MLRIAVVASLLLLAGCTMQAPLTIEFMPQVSGSTASLRGVCAVSSQVAWASGAEGTVLRTTDGGATWTPCAPADANELDFRDVEARDADTAWIMTAGTPARVYRTDDGGVTWTLQLERRDPAYFFNALDRDGDHLVLVGDPVDRAVVVFETFDGGASWSRVPGPVAGAADHGYAASGTVVMLDDAGMLRLALGGPSPRVAERHTAGDWASAELPMRAGETGGPYSFAQGAGGRFVAVGGAFDDPDTPGGTAAWSDRGLFWRPARVAPDHYCSVVMAVPGGFVAAADRRLAVSRDGITWSVAPAPPAGIHALSRSGKTGWAVGPDGAIQRFTLGAE